MKIIKSIILIIEISRIIIFYLLVSYLKPRKNSHPLNIIAIILLILVFRTIPLILILNIPLIPIIIILIIAGGIIIIFIYFVRISCNIPTKFKVSFKGISFFLIRICIIILLLYSYRNFYESNFNFLINYINNDINSIYNIIINNFTTHNESITIYCYNNFIAIIFFILFLLLCLSAVVKLCLNKQKTLRKIK